MTLPNLIARQQIKPSFISQCAVSKSCRHAKIGRIELTAAPLRQRSVDLVEKSNGVEVRRRGDPPDNNMSLDALTMFMINVPIAPAARTQKLEIL
jgi:hypothetical protein